ncbi:MAG: NADH-quinone oxidoreductase subunit D [Deltaproteobacteria bacterium]|nr:NADH-quinone oxidoreductase subunit D [Deltaproteobacteria bacterium]
MEPLDVDLDRAQLAVPTDTMLLSLGPSHPCMHGTVRVVVQLSGETITGADVQVGYLHRGCEKMCERGTFAQCLPYVDRLNYASPLLNGIGFALAIEKMLAVSVPLRCQCYRVVLGELARICDHMVCLGAMAMELGAFTPFLYFCKAREFIFDIFEEQTGARVTHSFARIGGMAKPPTDDFAAMVRASVPSVFALIDDSEKLLVKNRIFIDRTRDTGRVSAARALGLGWTGPALRSTGVPYDVRKSHPYLVYDQVEFEVPVGTSGDNFDRFAVRLEEMRQSRRIIEQVLRLMPTQGPVDIDCPRVTFPPKEEVYGTIEGTIRHFKLVVDGIQVPAGECYSYSEAANGELGFYIVSDGSGTPYRVRVRPPCFAAVQGLGQMLVGGMIPDVVPSFGSLNMIGGECDR